MSLNFSAVSSTPPRIQTMDENTICHDYDEDEEEYVLIDLDAVIGFFMWCLFHKKFNTNEDKEGSHGNVFVRSGVVCEAQTQEHLFFTCPFAKKIWMELWNIFIVNSAVSSNGLDTMNPILSIGDQLILIGEYEETIGTCYVFSEDEAVPVVHEETGPSEANLFMGTCIIDPSHAPAKQVNPVTSLQKILKFRLLPESDDQEATDMPTDSNLGH